MKLINYGYGILCYEDFITPEELAIIRDACYDPELWEHTEKIENISKPFIDNVLSVPKDNPANAVIQAVNQRIYDLVCPAGTKCQVEGSQIIRFRPTDADKNSMDVAMQLHHDKYNPLLVNGVVYYYNDNYEGGEIEYPDFNISIKPKPGMLVTHPAETMHVVQRFYGADRFFTTNYIIQEEFDGNDLGF